MGEIHSVLLDGVADFVLDVNCSRAWPEFVTTLHRLAIAYDTVIVCILHPNPGSAEKSRGHLGSQLQRKAETVLRLARNNNGVFTAYAEVTRNAPIYRQDGPRFRWSDEKGMHVTLAKTVREEKVAEGYWEMEALAKAIFASGPLAYAAAWSKIKMKFVEPGIIKPEYLQWGMTVLGQWREIRIYADEQTYENAAGAQVPFCDPKSILIGASGSANTIRYAGVPQAEDDRMEVFEGRRIPLVFFDKGEDYRKLRLSSRPVPIPSNTASWTILQVLA